jgi:glyoxylase-like metal-dependent hydrolase (beta-lactamase superfamily II)
MKVHVEPKPLHEPLAGGTPGATVSVEPMVAGYVTWSGHMMESPGGRLLTLKLLRALISGQPPVKVPCPAFLIRHPSAGAVLVDTGLHPSIASDPSENLGRLGARIISPSMEPGTDAAAQLREKGLSPGEIPIVVMTHMHLDHASAISEFANSTFILSEAEWEAATHGRRPLINGYRHMHYDYGFDYRTIDFNRREIDSYSSFGRTFDLFGDGSVRLAYTPGHSAGHISVIAHLKERDFVIGGDATYMVAQLRGNAPLPPRPADEHNFRRSLGELKRFAGEFPDAIVTPGHDPEFFSKLGSRFE